MEEIKILILGVDGMLGHKLFQVLPKEFGYNSVHGTSRKRNTNKQVHFYSPSVNFKEIEEIHKIFNFNIIINCIGILNNSNSIELDFFDINSYFPKALESTYSTKKVKIIHISTDCVFSGQSGNYNEESLSDARDVYGMSKFLGEINNHKDLTIRCSIIGPEIGGNSKGLLSWFLNQESKTIKGYKKVFWSGTSTLELSKMLTYAIKQDLTGLHHVSVPEKISKYELLRLFNRFSKTNIDLEIVPVEEPSYDKSLLSIKNKLLISKNYETIVKEMFEDYFCNYFKK